MLFKGVKAYEQAIFLLEQIVRIWQTVKSHGILPQEMVIYFFNLAVAYIEQANTFSEPEETKVGYQTAEKLLSKAMDCDPNHQDASKLYRWVSDRLK